MTKASATIQKSNVGGKSTSGPKSIAAALRAATHGRFPVRNQTMGVSIVSETTAAIRPAQTAARRRDMGRRVIVQLPERVLSLDANRYSFCRGLAIIVSNRSAGSGLAK